MNTGDRFTMSAEGDRVMCSSYRADHNDAYRAGGVVLRVCRDKSSYHVKFDRFKTSVDIHGDFIQEAKV